MPSLDQLELVLMRAAAFALFAAGALGWGLCLVRLPLGGAAEGIALRCAAGLVALSSGAFLVASLGLLTPLAAIGLLVVPWLAPRVWREAAALARRIAAAPRRSGAAALVAGALTAPVFLWAIYPPLGFDATLYHLPMAQSFLEAHRFVFLETLRFPAFPAFSELLFALLLPLAGDAGANLVQLAQFLLGGLVLYAAGSGCCAPAVGGLAAALWLGSPLMVWETSAAMVDLGVAFFALAAFLAFERWRRSGEGGALFWAGAFGGAAAATKYTGLLVAGALAVTVVGAGRQRRRGPALASLALGMVLVAAPHYLRIAVQSGNPLHPYFSAWSGDTRWQPTDEAEIGRRGPLERARSLLAFPYEAVFERQRWNRQPPPSPALVLLFAASLVLLRRPGAERRWLAAALFLLAASVSVLPPASHYLAPGFALACLPAAAVADLVLRRRRGGAGAAATLALTGLVGLGGSAYAAWHVAKLGPLPATAAARDGFLTARVRGYAALSWLNRRHGRDYGVYGLHLESSRHWSAGRFIGDWWGPWNYARFRASSRRGGELAALLREAGVDFLLVAPAGRAELPRDAAFDAWFRRLRRDADGTVLYALRPHGP